MWRVAFGIAVVCGWMGSAAAEPITNSDLDLSPISVAAEPSDTLAGGDVIAESELSTMAGGKAVPDVTLGDVQSNTQTPTATVDNNTLTGVATGQIQDANVLNNSGFTTVMVNTGNNVILQNTTNVNVILK